VSRLVDSAKNKSSDWEVGDGVLELADFNDQDIFPKLCFVS
jgi:hypothetical protein